MLGLKLDDRMMQNAYSPFKVNSIMKKLLLIISGTLFLTPAFAQNAFQGFYGQIATGYENNSISNTSLTMGPDPINFPGGNNPSNGSAPIIAGLGYNHSVSSTFLLGLGVDYSFISNNVGTAGINPSVQPNTGTTFKVSNRLNIFVTPSYVISADKLAYGKLGYSTQTISAAYWNNVDGQCNGNSMGSGRANGFILGGGYKQIIAGGLYGFSEANYYKYGNTSMSKSTLCDTTTIYNLNPSSSAYNFLVGLGYKF